MLLNTSAHPRGRLFFVCELKRAAYQEKLRSYCPKIITPEQYEEITGEKFENDSEV